MVLPEEQWEVRGKKRGRMSIGMPFLSYQNVTILVLNHCEGGHCFKK